MRITTYEEAFDLINVAYNDKAKSIIEQLNNEGYKEKSIAFCIWKSQDKIMSFIYDNRFWNVLINEVRKHGYK